MIFGSTGFIEPRGPMNLQVGAGLTAAWMLAFAVWGGLIKAVNSSDQRSARSTTKGKFLGRKSAGARSSEEIMPTSRTDRP